MSGNNDTGDNLSALSFTQVNSLSMVQTQSCEYLPEFLWEFEIVLMG
jgi:hypothetical protein